MTKTPTLIALILVLAFALAACDGDGDGDTRPTQAEVGAALQDPDNAVTHQLTSAFGEALGDDDLDCMAQVLRDAPISDEALRSIVEGDVDYRGTQEDAEAIEASATDIAHCLIQ